MNTLGLPNFARNAFVLLLMATLGALSNGVYAHHSYAIYDITTKHSVTGKLTRFAFTQPHIKIELEVTNEDGSIDTWDIESMAPRIWDNEEFDRDYVTVGETVTLVGFPARNGSTEMALSAIVSETKGELVVRNEIRQRSAREAAGLE